MRRREGICGLGKGSSRAYGIVSFKKSIGGEWNICKTKVTSDSLACHVFWQMKHNCKSSPLSTKTILQTTDAGFHSWSTKGDHCGNYAPATCFSLINPCILASILALHLFLSSFIRINPLEIFQAFMNF